MKKMCVYTHTHACTHTHTKECYWFIKKNKIWICTTAWMDLEGLKLSEINERERRMLLFICEIKKQNKSAK